jgi:RNase adapter protein RapZ
MSETPSPRRHLLYVTGMSGAGMSTMLRALEDIGYEAVDNLRPTLIPNLLTQQTVANKPLAIGIDCRNSEFNSAALLQQIEMLRTQPDVEPLLIFLECGDDALLRRFSETRRRHPLAIDRPVIDGIQQERGILAPLRAHADHVIDTSLFSLHDLRRLAAGQFRLRAQAELIISVTSFSFRQGVPREADLVFDVRFLANPHWDAPLRPLTGLDLAVGDYISADAALEPFLNGLFAWLLPLLPRYSQEGKSYLTIAIGCTGGKHRSVFVAEKIAASIAAGGFITTTHHRDLERGKGE